MIDAPTSKTALVAAGITGVLGSVGGVALMGQGSLDAHGLAALAERVGVPAAFCLAGLFVVVKALRWAAENLAKPALASHLDFVRTTSEAVQGIRMASEKQAQALEHLAAIVEAQREETKALRELLEKRP